ncbi:hypothetical protein [Rhizobium mesoamericanum]|uniref:hypothetical protein n=1 Tax=Rhizobium mesoamericanum TaxID=1079800 RepID=UPI000429A718|nr:hypothetical protein [Rhizobium mesoamericanum]
MSKSRLRRKGNGRRRCALILQTLAESCQITNLTGSADLNRGSRNDIAVPGTVTMSVKLSKGQQKRQLFLDSLVEAAQCPLRSAVAALIATTTALAKLPMMWVLPLIIAHGVPN